MKLIDPGRTEPALGTSELGIVDSHGDRVIVEGEVGRLVIGVVGASQRHGREEVKGEFSVRPGVLDLLALAGRLDGLVVSVTVFEGPWFLSFQQPSKGSCI